MNFLNDDDEDKNPLNAKLLIGVFAAFLIIGFVSVFFIMFPWLSFQKITDWRAVFIDNAIIFAIAGVFFFGFYMATRMR